MLGVSDEWIKNFETISLVSYSHFEHFFNIVPVSLQVAFFSTVSSLLEITSDGLSSTTSV